MTILIVEDELLIAEMLKEMLYDLGYNTVYVAKNYEQAQQQLALNTNIDLAFLDINLTNEKSGIDVAHHIKNTCKIPFIYLTSYSDPKTVKEATTTLPEAYLLKPFSKNDLFSTLEMVKAKYAVNSTQSIIIKEGNISIKLFLFEILYVKSVKNYLEVYTTSKRYVIRQSIENFMLELNTSKFMRVHRSFAVNIDKLDQVTSQELKIQDQIIPLSRNYKKDILSFFNK